MQEWARINEVTQYLAATGLCSADSFVATESILKTQPAGARGAVAQHGIVDRAMWCKRQVAQGAQQQFRHKTEF